MKDQVLFNDWHAVLTSADLGDTPVAIELMGERVVVFRTQYGVHAFKDLCVHRGAALSLGRIRENTLVCPYHGWRFSVDGRCVEIPAQPKNRPIPTKACVTKFACREKMGLIWVNMGNPRQDIPEYEEFNDPNYQTVTCGPYHVNASAPRVVENFLDVAHLMWVHEGLLGVPEYAEIADHEVHYRDGKWVSDEITVYQPPINPQDTLTHSYYIYEILRPLAVRLKRVNTGKNAKYSIFLYAMPVTEKQTTAFMLYSANQDYWIQPEEVRRFQDRIVAQDVPVVESQRPEELPLDLQMELHLKSDKLSITYRKWLLQLGVTLGTS